MYTLYRSPAAFHECLITVVITLLRTTTTQKIFLYFPLEKYIKNWNMLSGNKSVHMSTLRKCKDKFIKKLLSCLLSYHAYYPALLFVQTVSFSFCADQKFFDNWITSFENFLNFKLIRLIKIIINSRGKHAFIWITTALWDSWQILFFCIHWGWRYHWWLVSCLNFAWYF